MHTNQVSSLDNKNFYTHSKSQLKMEGALTDGDYTLNRNQNQAGKNKKKRKARSIFSLDQLKILNDEFEKNHYISTTLREDIAQRVGISQEQVKIWFQNMRSKRRKMFQRQKSGFYNNFALLQNHPNIFSNQNIINHSYSSNNFNESSILNNSSNFLNFDTHPNIMGGNQLFQQPTTFNKLSSIFPSNNQFQSFEYPSISNFQKANSPHSFIQKPHPAVYPTLELNSKLAAGTLYRDHNNSAMKLDANRADLSRTDIHRHEVNKNDTKMPEINRSDDNNRSQYNFAPGLAGIIGNHLLNEHLKSKGIDPNKVSLFKPKEDTIVNTTEKQSHNNASKINSQVISSTPHATSLDHSYFSSNQSNSVNEQFPLQHSTMISSIDDMNYNNSNPDAAAAAARCKNDFVEHFENNNQQSNPRPF